jgi:hypothetical protein
MAAETVQIVLQGVDNATPAFTSVARSIKETGDQSQKLSGAFGKVFNSLGLDILNQASMAVGDLSSQLKDLGEAGSKGGAGMMVARAGIVAAIGAAAVQVGGMIADWIYDTEAWGKRMQEVISEAGKQADFLAKKRQQQFNQQFQMASLATSPEQQQQEMAALAASVNQQIAQQAQSLQDSLADLKAVQARRTGTRLDDAGYQAELQAATELVMIETNRINQLKEQQKQVQNFYRLPTEAEAELKRRQEYAAKEQAAAKTLRDLQLEVAKIRDPAKAEREVILAQAANEEQRSALEFMLNMRDAAKERADAEAEGRAEMKAAIEETRRAMEQQAKTDKDYLERLRLQNVELTQGKRAADELRAAQSGVSEEVIAQGRQLSIQNDLLEAQKQLADEQKRQDEEVQKKLGQPAPQLQAMQSRLLTRSGNNPNDRAIKANEKTAELTAKIERLQQEQLAELRKNKGGEIIVLGS